jgi:hypothetical protein
MAGLVIVLVALDAQNLEPVGSVQHFLNHKSNDFIPVYAVKVMDFDVDFFALGFALLHTALSTGILARLQCG